ncbi:universal stress protein [Flindersiella endophytica]
MYEPRSIVVGVDETWQSQLALVWACREAFERHRPLRIVRVYGVTERLVGSRRFGPLGAPPSSVRRQLEDAVAYAGDRMDSVEATGVLTCDRPARALLKESANAELVVVGAHRTMGSAAFRVAAHATCPVVVARQSLPGRYARPPIVVGVDGSERSEAAIGFAFEEADRQGLPLIAVHCWQVGPADRARWDAGARAETRARHIRWMAESLAGYGDKFPDVELTSDVVTGPAARRLVGYTRGARLIVVGTRGHGGAAGALPGSVSQALLRRAHCPVAVVRA